MSSHANSYTGFIQAALTAATEIAMSHYGRVTVTEKDGDNNQVVTEADLEVGHELIRRVRETYPEHAIIDEEAGYIPGAENGAGNGAGPASGAGMPAQAGPQYTWIVDPIDGTSNFAAAVPLFGIMFGLLRDGLPVAGGVSLPALGELYLAERGGGAFCNGERITVSAGEESLESLVAYGVDGHQEDPERTRREMRVLGEIALNVRNIRTSNSVFDQMMVARGSYGACLNQSSRIWDNVAAHMIIEEAGGKYTDFVGDALDYRIDQRDPDYTPERIMRRTFTWCAGAPGIHAQLQKLVWNSR